MDLRIHDRRPLCLQGRKLRVFHCTPSPFRLSQGRSGFGPDYKKKTVRRVLRGSLHLVTGPGVLLRVQKDAANDDRSDHGRHNHPCQHHETKLCCGYTSIMVTIIQLPLTYDL